MAGFRYEFYQQVAIWFPWLRDYQFRIGSAPDGCAGKLRWFARNDAPATTSAPKRLSVLRSFI
jgi:hypothetical protein